MPDAAQPLSGPSGTAGHAIQVTPSNSVSLADSQSRLITARGLGFGGAGDISVVMAGGETMNFTNGQLAAGIIHPMMITRVNATGTTATNIFVVY